VLNSTTTAEKQLLLINRATAFMDDGIYIRAAALLEEAAGYDAMHNSTAETELKKAYLALIDKRGFSRKYISLLEKQMDRKNAEPYIFIEAADYYINASKTHEALAVLKDGVNKTGDEDIIALYEKTRYAFEISRASYDDVTMIFNQTVQVKLDGKWGIASSDGIVIIPCKYEKISTFYNDRAIVSKNGQIFAIDRDDNRIAVTGDGMFDFGNYADNRVPILINSKWHRATGEFDVGPSSFDDFGMYSNSFAAAKIDGKWGVIGLSDKWLIPAIYDEVIMDELGRCYAQGAVFVRDGDYVYLIKDGELTGDIYQDAHPFGNEGYAAVKLNGKWGFIDNDGLEAIPFVFEEAFSFEQHLAAVRLGDLWGYINISGQIVIEMEFHSAKTFSGGRAPVLTDRGWQFITLIEYKKGISL